jgi:hypothetical protein
MTVSLSVSPTSRTDTERPRLTQNGPLRMTPEALVRVIDLVTLPDEPARDPTPEEMDRWLQSDDDGGEE